MYIYEKKCFRWKHSAIEVLYHCSLNFSIKRLVSIYPTVQYQQPSSISVLYVHLRQHDYKNAKLSLQICIYMAMIFCLAAILYFSAILEVVKMSNCVKHYTMIVFQT